MRLSVAICTRDRARLLDACLASLAGAAVPRGVEWEVVVVDNGSRDHTPQVLESFRERLPLVTVSESTPGLSAARNRAVTRATGDYILWTDDDTRVAPRWLAAYHEAFLRWPRAAVFGGPITPRFEGHPPSWLQTVLPAVAGAFALRDLGSEPVPLGIPGALPFGANFAVRAVEQRRHLYRLDLGRMPGGLGLGHEETEMIRRIFQAGGTGWWVPAASVEHWIPRERQSLGYLRRHAASVAEYEALRSEVEIPPSPWSMWLSAIHAELRYRYRRLVRPPERWIVDLKVASAAWGRLRAMRRSRQGFDGGPIR